MPINQPLETALRERSPGAEAVRKSQERARARRSGDTEFGATAEGRPSVPDIPEFELPEYDETKVAGLAQKIAAPRVRTLRETTREAISRRGPGYENPNIRRMTVRQALKGYGTGLESLISGARKGAVSEYGQQYGAAVNAAQMNYQTKVSTTMAQYQNLWKEYLTKVQNPELSGGGVRIDPNYRPPTTTVPPDPNDPGTIGGRPIYTGPGQ